jgi:hypothetical protein
MSSHLSDTEICNMALDLLEEAPIDSINDDRSVARWFKRNFWPAAWTLMRRHPWNFALSRAKLTTLATAPAFGFANAFAIPADCLRVLPLSADGTENGREVPFKVEGDVILTDADAPLTLRYISRVASTGLFDNHFADALAANLAMKASHFITGKQSYAERMGQMFQAALADAEIIDALEGTPDDAIADFWLDARQ